MTGYACGARSYADVGTRVRVQLCYAGVFADAPTLDELVARCAPDDPATVRSEIDRLIAEGQVRRAETRLVLSEAEGVRRQEEPMLSLEEALEARKPVIDFLRRSSMVELVAVSGSMAHGGTTKSGKDEADLDLFIISAPASLNVLRLTLRIWEALHRLASRLSGSGGRYVRVCPNYVTDISFLEVSNKSLFTATDSVRVRLLKGPEAYRRFLAANAWIGDYYPWVVPPDPAAEEAPGRPGRLRALANMACFALMAAYSSTRSALRREAPDYSTEHRRDRSASYLRRSQALGGYEPQVAERFIELYRASFGDDPSLFAFLFPSRNGERSPWIGDLGYHA